MFIEKRNCDFDHKLKELSVLRGGDGSEIHTFATSIDVPNLHSSDIDSQNSNRNRNFIWNLSITF